MLHIAENLSDTIQREAHWFGELLPASQEPNNRHQLWLGDKSVNSKFTKNRITSLRKHVSQEDAAIDYLGLTVRAVGARGGQGGPAPPPQFFACQCFFITSNIKKTLRNVKF